MEHSESQHATSGTDDVVGVSHADNQRASGNALSGLLEEWPRAERSLVAGLRRRGVPPEIAAELVQETALRLLTARPAVGTYDDLFRWSWRVCRNLEIGWRRRLAPTAEIDPDTLVASDDVAWRVEQRLRAAATATAFRRLSDADQTVLSSAIVQDDRGATKRERDRFALQLLRARRRLEALIGAAGAVAAWMRARMRPQHAEQIAAAMLTATVAAVMVIAPIGGGEPPSRRASPSRQSMFQMFQWSTRQAATEVIAPREVPEGLHRAKPTVRWIAEAPLPLDGRPLRAGLEDQPEPEHELCVSWMSVDPGCADLPDLAELPLVSDSRQ